MKKLLLVLSVGTIILSLVFIFWPSDSRKYIDLRKKLPKGDFLSVSIVQANPKNPEEHIYLEIEESKLAEFQEDFNSKIKTAKKTSGAILKYLQLRIDTDRGRYYTYLIWTDKYIRFKGLRSYELREVFLKAGLKTMKEPNPGN